MTVAFEVSVCMSVSLEHVGLGESGKDAKLLDNLLFEFVFSSILFL